MSQDHFWWFRGASVRELRDRLNAVSDIDTARLEVHHHGNDGLMLFVKSAGDITPFDTGGGGGVNDSFKCPPVCP
jgi:hypothetical protein